MRKWLSPVTILFVMLFAIPFAGFLRPLPVTAQEVVVPPGDASAAPIVLVLHGGGGTGARLRARSGFDALAAEHGVVAVYPDAPGQMWNDGRDAALGRDDTDALLALVDELAGQGIGDPARLFVIGHSNGGSMAMRLACDHPGRIAGIAVVAAKILPAAPCRYPEVPVPALFIHGTADAIAPHRGRRVGDPDPAIARRARRFGETLGAAETLAVWSRRNQCSGEEMLGDGAVHWRNYLGCRAPLRWIEVEGGDHAWPSALHPWRSAPELDAGRAALAFWLG